MKHKSIILVLALLATSGATMAETPNERCVTNGMVNVTTLPLATDKMWHQASSPSLDHILHSAIWFKLPKGIHIDLFAAYIDKAGVEWAWGSAIIKFLEGDDVAKDAHGDENGGTIVSGWVRHSSLKC